MKTLVLAVLAIVVLGVAVSFGLFGNQSPNGPSYSMPITVYKSQSCGCCDQYIGYLRGRGFQVSVVDTNDMDTIKTKHGVPASMQSCHTSAIGDYFVEGHVPIEAINKLIEEKPDIKGIAMPGMPTGSPGMGGVKNSPFTIYSISDNGSAEFMRI